MLDAGGTAPPPSARGGRPHDVRTRDGQTRDGRTHDGQSHDVQPWDVEPLDAPAHTGSTWSPRTGHDGSDGAPSPWLTGRRRTLLTVAVALVVGVLLGTVVAGNRADAAARAERRAALVVDARIATSAITSQRLGDARAQITARVRNLGPEPVELLLDAETAVPSTDDPVTVTGEPGELVPGASSVVRADVALVCGVQQLPVLVVRVRTSDGRPHDVPLQPFGTGDPLEALCANVTNSTPRVQAELQGSVDRPLLRIRNTRPVAVVVDLPERVSSGPGGLDGLVTISASLPELVAGLGERTIALQVTARRCERDLDVIEQLGAFARPTLRLTDARGDRLDTSTARDAVGTSVDLTQLVSQALARACR